MTATCGRVKPSGLWILKFTHLTSSACDLQVEISTKVQQVQVTLISTQEVPSFPRNGVPLQAGTAEQHLARVVVAKPISYQLKAVIMQNVPSGA